MHRSNHVCFECRTNSRIGGACYECGAPTEAIGYKLRVPPKDKIDEWKMLNDLINSRETPNPLQARKKQGGRHGKANNV